MSYTHINEFAPADEELPTDVVEQVEIQMKYEGYIEKSLQQVERLKKMEDKRFLNILTMMRFMALLLKRAKS